jgi:hypothetical protein
MSRTTFFLSTRGQPPGFHAFTIANDDLPDRPATAGFALRGVSSARRTSGHLAG